MGDFLSLKDHHCHTRATLIRLAVPEAVNLGVPFKKISHAFPQYSGSLAMNDMNLAETAQQGIV